ncbi:MULTISPECIES: universal stress protein [unclassified Ruegeria]|uniref:universal stress protein n=1 Tax=unclassified Ruegeria TaxID=2625375 RepID=UPI001488C320|nr:MULTISPECIES: universal stress protein [unclassified Ruegeria]NOD45712.1 universal stress protein [Ruegeria sp. HKCCD5849]NOD50988.1 universal stress protein [Ruegeria sp. HKCCD5851]NOD67795.1 universal stress protein [Ruegeria sp. HKCCD7303]
MERRTILFVMNVKTEDHEIGKVAEMAAREDHHLLCLMLDMAPALPAYSYSVPPYGGLNIPDDWKETLASTQANLKFRCDIIEQLLAQRNASGEVEAVLTASMDTKHVVARFARVSDEAIFSQSLRETRDLMTEAASGVLFHSPIGFRINANLARNSECIFVAWDSSEAASAAVHAALPHLLDAREVIIGCIDPVTTVNRDGQDPGTDVAAWLSHHGCLVTLSQYPSGGRSVADVIQDRAAESGSDLIVMGAYGQARMIQTVLGGTTRSMVEQTKLPVFLAH